MTDRYLLLEKFSRRDRDSRSRERVEEGSIYRIIIEKATEFRCQSKNSSIVIIPKKPEVKVTVFQDYKLFELLYF